MVEVEVEVVVQAAVRLQTVMLHHHLAAMVPHQVAVVGGAVSEDESSLPISTEITPLI